MALSGSFSGSIIDGAYTLRVDWTATQSITNNTTTPTFKFYLVMKSAWSINVGTRTASQNSATAAGTSKGWASNAANQKGGEKYLGSVTFDPIEHNDDGSKSITVSAEWFINFTYQATGRHYDYIETGNKTITFDTIPRKSSITAGDGTLGSEHTITINRKASSFTHTLRYYIGDDYWTIATKTSSTSVKWTPPIERASYNTTGTSIAARLVCITYNGDTKIGESSKSITLAIPSSVAPTCAVSVTDPTGHKDTYGYFVKGLSKVRVQITGTPAHGSPINTYAGAIDSTQYDTADFTADLYGAGDTIAVSAKVTDKRGRSDTWSGSYNVLEYTPPKVSALSVHRVNADGTENDEGGYVQVVFSASVNPLRDRNTARYTLRYKKAVDADFTPVTLSALNDVYTVNNYAYRFAADADFAYDIEVEAKDNHQKDTEPTSASTAFTLMNWHESGKGIGLGMVAESTGLASALPLKLYGGIESIAADKAAAARAALGFGKHLWGTSDWSATNPVITVPELQSYRLFVLKVKGVSLDIIATRVGSNFRGIGGYPLSGSGTRIYTLSAVISGETLTLTLCNFQLHSSGGSHTEAVDVGITDIWGIV